MSLKSELRFRDTGILPVRGRTKPSPIGKRSANGPARIARMAMSRTHRRRTVRVPLAAGDRYTPPAVYDRTHDHSRFTDVRSRVAPRPGGPLRGRGRPRRRRVPRPAGGPLGPRRQNEGPLVRSRRRVPPAAGGHLPLPHRAGAARAGSRLRPGRPAGGAAAGSRRRRRLLARGRRPRPPAAPGVVLRPGRRARTGRPGAVRRDHPLGPAQRRVGRPDGVRAASGRSARRGRS